MDQELTTERFVLRPLAANDAQPLHALWTDESVRRFLWDGRAIALDETRAIVEESGRLFRENGLGLWTIREREGDARVRAAYGRSWDRLVALKRKFDPDNFFRLNQNVNPAG